MAENLKDLATDCKIPEEECPSLDGTLKVEGVTERRLCTPLQTGSAPSVSYSGAKEGVKYCLIMTDPDAPSRAEPSYRSFCHWVVNDLYGEAQHKVPYCGPGPPCNSGLHRYAFCLYEQPDDADLDSLTKALEGRGGTCAHEAAKAARLGPMVAIEYYEAEWDDSVDAIHESIGFVPPPKFRSPAQLAKHGDV